MNYIVTVLNKVKYYSPLSFYDEHYDDRYNIIFNLSQYKYRIKSRKDYIEYIIDGPSDGWIIDLSRELDNNMPRRIGDILISHNNRVIINMKLFAIYPDTVCIAKVSIHNARYIGSMDTIFTGSYGEFKNSDMIA